jgi:hypothetical protein
LGGPNKDQATGISLAPRDLVAITGYTGAPFPLFQPYQAVYGGARDAIVASIALNPNVLSSTTLAGAPNPSSVGQRVGFTATVTGNGSVAPTGTVTFRDGAKLIATSPLINGEASVKAIYNAAATHSITAVYSGDANYIDSRSEVWNQVIQ